MSFKVFIWKFAALLLIFSPDLVLGYLQEFCLFVKPLNIKL